MTSSTKNERQMSVILDATIWNGVKALARTRPGVTLKWLAAEAVRRELAVYEQEQFVLDDPLTGTRVAKAPGELFPARLGNVKTGLPTDQERELDDVRRVNIRLPESLHERWYNALFWLDRYPSHATEEALQKLVEEYS